MADVGFELGNLCKARTAAGHLRAHSYSAILTAGPFALLAGMVLAIQLLFLLFGVSEQESALYIGSVVYSFVFSQILACGLVMVLNRYVADCLAAKWYDDVTASLFGMSALVTGLGGVAAAVFLWGKPLDFFTKLLGYLLFGQLLLLWVQSVYLSAVRKYERLLLSCAAGVCLSIGCTAFFLVNGWLPPAQGALFSMDLGIGVMVFLFFLHITSHFGMPKAGMRFGFLPHLERHGRLFFVAVCDTVGLFLPNIMVWQSSWGVVVEGTYRFAPVYDVVTFYAFLSLLPLMTMLAVSVESSVCERYAKYRSCIVREGNFREIDDARKDLLHTLWFELRRAMEFQLVITLLFLALGSYFLSWAGIAYHQVNMFHVLLFAAFFTGILRMVCVLLICFDSQREVLKIAVSFFAGNLLLGLIGIFWLGEKSYGFTFFLASGFSLFYGLMRLHHFAARMNYFVFCAQPMFYLPPRGIFTKIARKLYGERLIDLERKDSL